MTGISNLYFCYATLFSVYFYFDSDSSSLQREILQDSRIPSNNANASDYLDESQYLPINSTDSELISYTSIIINRNKLVSYFTFILI